MFRNRVYYQIKPLVPWSCRLAIRRRLALRKRPRAKHIWPIIPGSERPPEGWPGWPNGKQFAFVLTHDIEGKVGVAKCRPLMELERKLGFRSAFNFIPEGGYAVPRELRDEMTRDGFELGVHDLQHDGKIYRSRQLFAQKAIRINRYLKEWGAVGFRSGFMFHKLDWLHDLDIEYDASTFDTDPFEPQPEGSNTIFPFWIRKAGGGGYVEWRSWTCIRTISALAVKNPASGHMRLSCTGVSWNMSVGDMAGAFGILCRGNWRPSLRAGRRRLAEAICQMSAEGYRC
jgi:hypothetical protein